jgi:hypothetical protein
MFSVIIHAHGSHTMKEEVSLLVFENREVMKIYELREAADDRKYYTLKEFIICTLHLIL